MTQATTLPITSTVSAQAPRAPVDAGAGLTFGEVLSDLNPLQYLPVVGTIYRAVTGDTIPQPLREVGSVLVGGLIGGPIGLATSLGTLAFEKLTGIDFEEVGQRLLSGLGHHDTAQSVAAPQAASSPPAEAVASGAWTPAQLAAYGITTEPNGELRQGALAGADLLNALQLSRMAAGAGA